VQETDRSFPAVVGLGFKGMKLNSIRFDSNSIQLNSVVQKGSKEISADANTPKQKERKKIALEYR
jgi:hypothetical protein